MIDLRVPRSLPIAAHLAILIALAFAAAFVANLTVLSWVPPPVPSLMRGDQVIDAFELGFEAARRSGHAPEMQGFRWSVVDRPTEDSVSPIGALIAPELAARLALPLQNIRISAPFPGRGLFLFQAHERQDGTSQKRVPNPPQAPDIPTQTQPGRENIVISRSTTTSGQALPDGPSASMVLMADVTVAAPLSNGKWLVMRSRPNVEERIWLMRAILFVGAALALVAVASLVFAQRLARPIQDFATAAEAVGVNPHHAPLNERGPRELLVAARAVNAMQRRLRALIADRTQALATVAHDMRTPLMRLRLAVETAELAQRQKMLKEIQSIDALVASFIAFARDDPAEEPRTRLDLGALLQSLVDDEMAAGHAVSFEGEESLVIVGQTLGLKRLFSNLIDNALKYGGAARVRLTGHGAEALADIEDDGPGIPSDQHEAVFRPFVRLRADSGGAGLGLTAARSIARAHGGEVTFLDQAEGAIVRVVLPL